jgi:hypothetical protein
MKAINKELEPKDIELAANDNKLVAMKATNVDKQKARQKAVRLAYIMFTDVIMMLFA